MSSPKVSIILTTHGPAPYLKQAIGSVLAQTFEDWECIVVRDGPMPDDYWYSDDRIMDCSFFVNPAQCRFAFTINQVFKECKGNFITYLCHDDLYLPWRLESMFSAFERNSSWDIFFGHQQLITEFTGVGGSRNVSTLDSIRIGNPDQPAGTVDHSSVIHRRECFERAGGWDENAPARYGDAYFWLRLQNAGYKFHCIPEVLDVHRFNQHSISWKLDHPEAESAKA